jgi:hypothetical protein
MCSDKTSKIRQIPSEKARDYRNELALDLARQETTRVSAHAGGAVFKPGRGHVFDAVALINSWLTDKPSEEPPPPQEVPPPPPLLDSIELDTAYIAFGGGVPVGGYSHLSLFPNGAYSFTGHFHDSGWPSYDMELVWVLRSSAGTVLTFSHRGRVHGTGESGSRDDDWGDSGTNAALAAAWADISAGYSWQWHAAANGDIGAMIDQAVKTLGQAAAVIAIVA